MKNPFKTDSQWTDICAVDDIPVLGSRIVERRGTPNIAIFRNSDNEIFALDDWCPHKGGPLSQGIVFGKRVACPFHNWSIDLENGCALAPDEGCTPTFDLKVEEGRVFLDVNSRHLAPGVIPIHAMNATEDHGDDAIARPA